MVTYQEIIEGIETLPVDEQDNLFKLILKRRTEQRRSEIAANGDRLRQSIEDGTAQRFNSVEDLKSYLFAEDDE
jgi:hypothetical protein